MASNLVGMASNLLAMASNLLQPRSDGLQPIGLIGMARLSALNRLLQSCGGMMEQMASTSTE